MGKSSSSRVSRADSEVSSRSEKRRTQDELDDTTPTRRRSQAESVTSSNSRRRSSRRDNDRDEQDDTRSSRYTSQGYTESNEPLSYVNQANTESYERSKRSESDLAYQDSRRESRRDGIKSSSRGHGENARALDDEADYRRRDDDRKEPERSKRRDSKRDSTTSRRSERDERSRALNDHDASLPQNQFPGSFPDTNTQPYRPPGQAADYYGDQGESVQFQPGVRPQGPAFVTNAEQAHLHGPSVEAAPPPEPSSMGQIGAAASYFNSEDSDAYNGGSSSRPQMTSSPKVTPVRPGRMSSTAGSVAATSAMGAAAAGAAAQYFASNNTYSSSQTYHDANSTISHQTPSQYTAYQGGSYSASPSGKPTKISGSSPNYAGMAAAGLAGAAAAGYYAQHHHHHEHGHGQPSPYMQGANTTFVVGQGQSAFPGMQQQLRHKHRGPLTKIADWFRDPQGVSQFEQYSEAIGVCRYCFDPNSNPLDAPRKHYYHKPRPAPQPGRVSAASRIEKPYRHSVSSTSSSSSSDDDKKRKRSSTAAKLAAGGIAAYGATRVGEAVFNQQHNFDDTYSVKSGQPILSGASQTTVNRVDYEDGDMYGAGSRKRSSKGSRYSVSEDVNLRRKDSTSSRKSRHDDSDRKRSSRRRDSSSSPSGLSRGALIGAGAAAGAAGIAAMAASERRRSRSRSKDRSSKLNRKRSYYSKRVSPRHSYVDLSTKASGAVGFGQFFSSPSANERKGKKKGFFTWTNDSSSSSDADLAFGEGTVKRKSGKQGRSGRDSPSKFGDTAAILGLAATGAALAAESDRRKSKSRRDANDVNTGYGSRRASTNRISMRDHGKIDVDGDGVWEDASDDESSSASVDTALAYGGRLSNKNSRESLAEQGTSKWAWRWNKGKDKPVGRERRQTDSVYPQTPPHRDAYNNMASAGVAGAIGVGAGIAAATMMDPNPKFSATTPSPLPPMQFVEPFAASDPHLYEARRISKVDAGPSPHTTVSRSPAPLQQPQAIVASSAAPIPAILNKLESDARLRESPDEIKYERRKVDSERRVRKDSAERTRPSRRNSSPALVNPSNLSKNSVTWDLTDEQLQNERRAQDKLEKRRRRRDDDDDRRRSADFATPDRTVSQEDRASELRKESLDRHEDRRAQIDRELQELYEQHKRQMSEQKVIDSEQRSHGDSSAVSAAIVGAGVGAAATAIMSESKKSSESDSDKKPRRKSSLKRGSIDTSVVSAPVSTRSATEESPKERSPNTTAPKSRTASSPSSPRSPVSPVRDDYAAFFVPADVAEHVKEHNDAAEKRERDREVIDFITPDMLSAGRQKRFDPWLYSPYRPGKPHQPDYHPRGVPKLDIIEATPPGSPGGARLASRSSPLTQQPMVTEDADVAEQSLDHDATSTTGSKVNWGDNSTHVYDVETPEYERNDPTAEFERVRPVKHDDVVQPANKDYDNVKRVSNDVPIIKEPVVQDRSPEPSPLAEVDINDILGGQPYQKPFYESVSDMGEIPLGDDRHRDVPKTGHGFAVSLPESPVEERREPRTAADQVVIDETTADERPSRTERRRLERALSSSENVTPVLRSSEPEPIVSGHDEHKPAVVEPEQQMPGGFGVFDYLVDDDGKQMTAEDNRKIEATAASTLSRRSEETSRSKEVDDAPFAKPKRAATFDDVDTAKSATKTGAEYASDPEDWERSTKKKSKKDRSSKSRGEIGIGSREAFAAVAAGAAAAAAAKALDKEPDVRSKDSVSAVGSEPDFYASSSKDKKKRRSKRESEIFEDYDNKSVVSLPATKDEDRKSRRRSRRESEAFEDDDDDLKSVTSMPATKDEDSKSKRRAKDKDREKEKEKEKERRSSGLFGGIFSSNKSDISASSKKSSKSSKSEPRSSRDEDDKAKRRNRRSKSTDDYEDHTSNSSRQQRRDSLDDGDSKPYIHESFAASMDDGFVSADDGQLNEARGNQYNDENQSFLAKGLEMPLPTVTHIPMDTDGVSGQITKRQVSTEALLPTGSVESTDDILLPPLPEADDDEQTALQAVPASATTPSTERTRRLSALRTNDADPIPAVMSSPTAVPLPFGRRGPFTPVNGQRSGGSPSIGSPLTTPRTRMNRPKSTSGKDFKPLYLVERHSFQKTSTPDEEENFPSLPSSRASSARPSMEDIRGTAILETDVQAFTDRGRRHSYSSVEEHHERRQSPDYLDSRAATPVPGDKQKARDREMLEIRERKEKEQQWKGLFHSPSELLQDPALSGDVQEDNVDVVRVGSPLPSVVSTDHDQEFMSAESRPESPIFERDVSAVRQPRSRSQSRERRTMGEDVQPEQPSRSRSKSRDMIAATGLGIAGGMMAGFAANSIFNDPSTLDKNASTLAMHPTKDDLIPKTEDDELFAPTTSKKSKKDKKKKRKTLDLSEPTDADDPVSQENGGVRAADDGVVDSQQTIEEPIVFTSPFAEMTPDRETAVKKSKKDKKKNKKSKPSDESLPDLDISAAREIGLDHGDEPSTAVLAGNTDVGFALDKDIGARDAFTAAVTAKILADSEKESIPDAVQEDEVQAVIPSTESNIRSIPANERFVPTFAQMNQQDNQLGAFEEAFERAVRARGLKEDVTREEAVQIFLPKRDNAPFVPKLDLTPVPEGSPASATSPKEEAVQRAFDQVLESPMTRKLSKKDKKKSRKSNLSTPDATNDVAADAQLNDPLSMKNPFGNDFELEPQTILAEIGIAREAGQVGPSFDKEPLELTTAPEDQNVGFPTDTTEANDDDFAWAPSKKEKKKKKNRSSVITPSTAAELAAPDEAGSLSKDHDRAVVDEANATSTPVEDEWDQPSTKKGKKGKKNKKGQANLDWTDVTTMAAAGAVAGAAVADVAGSSGENEKPREIVAEPTSLPEDNLQDPANESVSISREDRFLPDNVITETGDEDLAPVTGKKSKKDKKRKSKSTAFEDWPEEPSGESNTMSSQESADLTADGAQVLSDDRPDPTVANAISDNATRSIGDNAVEDPFSGQKTEEETGSLSRKASKKDKKKKKRSSALDLTMDENTSDAGDRHPGEGLRKDFVAGAAVATAVAATAAIATKLSSNHAQEDTTRELITDVEPAIERGVSPDQPAESVARALDDKSTTHDDEGSAKSTIEASSAPPDAGATRPGPQAPPNPFAMNLSMADAIALSMGQNAAALTAAKPKKKKKNVVGQGSSWTTWTPTSSAVGEADEISSTVSRDLNVASGEPVTTTGESVEVRNASIEAQSKQIEAEDPVVHDDMNSSVIDTQPDIGDVDVQGSEQQPGMERSIGVEEVTEPATDRNLSDIIPESLQEAPQEAGWNDFEAPKTSKKDKKKKRKSAATTFEDSGLSTPLEDPARAEQVVDSTVSEPLTLTEKPVTLEASEEQLPAEEPVSQEAEPEDTWAYTTKKSKKDKKNKRKSTVDIGEPVTSAEPLSASIQPAAEAIEDAPVEESTNVTPLEPQPDSNQEQQEARSITDTPVEDEWAIPIKTSKKDKKKKRKSVVDVEENVSPVDKLVETETETALPIQPESGLEESSVLPLTEDAFADPQSRDAPEQLDEIPEAAEWSIPTTSSKKDKKKKKKLGLLASESVIPDDEPSIEVGQNDLSPQEIMSEETSVPESAGVSDKSPQEVVETPAEDEWALPTKQSKKDKKKKKKAGLSTDWDDPESSAISENKAEEVVPDVKLVLPEGIESQAASVSDTLVEDPITAEPVTGEPSLDKPAEEDDWAFASTSSKKKNKKKKGGQSGTSSRDEPDMNAMNDAVTAEMTDVQQQPEFTMETSEAAVPADNNGFQVTPPEQLQEANDDEWANFTTKSSKKSKKKKGNKSGSVSRDEPNVEADDAVMFAEPTELQKEAETIEDPFKTEGVVNEDDTVPTTTEATQEANEDEWASFSTKPSKKNKKKKGGKSETTSRDELAIEADTNAGSMEAPVVPEQEDLAQQPMDVDVSVNDQVILDTAAAPAPEANDDEWASFITKPSKKDKKKKRKSGTTSYEGTDVEGITSLDSSEQVAIPQEQESTRDLADAKLPADDPEAPPATSETVQAGEDDEWASFATKSSKKDKKKKRKSGLTSWDEPHAELIDTAKPDEAELPQREESPSATVETEALVKEEDTQAIEVVPVQDVIDDEWTSFNTKPSKKDKKKKRKSGIDPVDDPVSEATSMETSEVIEQPQGEDPARDSATTKTPAKDEDAITTATEPIQDVVDDEWASFTTKPSKKDKKKKRKSDIDLQEEPVNEAASVITSEGVEAPQGEKPGKDLVEAETPLDDDTALATSAEPDQSIVDDDWANFTTKSSKKDKKKKRKSSLSPDTEEQIVTEPDVSEFRGGEVEQTDADQATLVKELDMGRAATTDEPAAESVAQPSDAVLDNISQEPEAPIADEWSFSRKPSKKDKKKKKKDQSWDNSEPEEVSSKPDTAAERDGHEVEADSAQTAEGANIVDEISNIKDRSISELHSHDTHQNWLSAAQEAASDFPTANRQAEVSGENNTAPPSLDVEMKEATSESVQKDLSVAQEVEAEDEFAFIPAKKNKKDKKKDKRKSTKSADDDNVNDALLAVSAGTAAIVAASAIQKDEESLQQEAVKLPQDETRDIPAGSDQRDNVSKAVDASMPGTFEDVADTPNDTQNESVFASALATPGESQDQQLEEVFWATAFKKNKKDKKKRKSVTWSDADTSTPATPANEDLPETPLQFTRDLEEIVAEPSTVTQTVDTTLDDEPAAIEPEVAPIETQTTQPDLPTPGTEKEEFDWSAPNKRKSKKDKKKRGLILDEDTEQTSSGFVTPQEPDPTAELQEAVPEEWTDTSAKKKKKDKKKKQTSSALDWTQSEPERMELDVEQTEFPAVIDKMVVDEDHDLQTSSSRLEPDPSDAMEVSVVAEPEHQSEEFPLPSISAEAGKRELSSETTAQDVVDREEPATEPVEDEWALPGKKSKKDKKKKKKGPANNTDDVDMEDAALLASAAAVTTAIVASDSASEVPREDIAASDGREEGSSPLERSIEVVAPAAETPVAEEWSFGSKSKKEKKKKKRQSRMEDDVLSPEADLPVSSMPIDQDKQVPISDPVQSTVDAIEQDHQAESTSTEPATSNKQEIVEEEWGFAGKKSKKEKKKKRQSTANTFETTSDAVSTPRDSQNEIRPIEPQQDVPNYVQDYSIHELHEAPQHQDYLSTAHTIATAFPSQPSSEQTRSKDITTTALENVGDAENTSTREVMQPEIVEDSDTGSNVSEETRERRRRRGRRSPPLRRDHDPEDLPRDRALTPPPEHEDMMDTALTIAAGLGFGENQDAFPQVEPVEPRSSQPNERSVEHPALRENEFDAKFESQNYNRDSGIQFDSPVLLQHHDSVVRDSGFVPSPPLEDTWERSGTDESPELTRRRTRPHSPTSSTEDLAVNRRSVTFVPEHQRDEHSFSTPARRQPLPVDSATKERSSVVFNSSPAAGSTPSKTPRSDRKSPRGSGGLRITTPESHHTPLAPIENQQSRAESPVERGRRIESRSTKSIDHPAAFVDDRSILHADTRRSIERSMSPSKLPLQTIHEGSSPMTMAAVGTAVLGLGTAAFASTSRDRGDPSQSKYLGSPQTRTSPQRSLRGSAISPNNFDLTEDAAAAASTARGMSGNDVYDGFGSFPGSPISPTRPPSVRKRQSMQQIRDLEARVDQLADENRSLAEAKLIAERHLEEFQSSGAPRSGADDEALQSVNQQLEERDHEISKLRAEITALAAAHATLKTTHDEKHTQLETSSRELVGLRSQHEELSSGMEEIVKHEIATALVEKNAELQRLRLDLENARLKIRELQSEILATRGNDIVVIRDEDYFENACQNLCQHVQGWVVRFSKFSDTRVCRSMKEVRDEKVLDRFDNALLDGSDIDPYLADRVKRRDVFMSVVMTMIWEYVFTRYLFGMDRDQRQKLKQLEKNLAEVGPAHAVHQWRALTLTLLSKRESFRAQLDNDTEAVVVEVMKALSRFLPPPQNLEAQISESLRKVMRIAVDLSIEMRTQRAEYIMLPPLQPEYDTQGDLMQKVYFNANLMNERSGEFESNEQLEESKSVVRIVLFPLVVKKGDDGGRGDAELVICPAQVLVARADKGKRPKSRITSAGSAVDARSLRAASTHSLAMSGVDMTGNMI